MTFISRPSDTLWAYLREERAPGSRRWYEYGQLAMALEVVTLIKVVESLPVVGEVGRQETVSALQTLLVDTGLSDYAWQVYDELGKWRRVKFLETEREPAGTVVVVSSGRQGLLFDPSSFLEERGDDSSLRDEQREPSPERQSLDDGPNASSEGEPSSANGSTPT